MKLQQAEILGKGEVPIHSARNSLNGVLSTDVPEKRALTGWSPCSAVIHSSLHFSSCCWFFWFGDQENRIDTSSELFGFQY